MKYAKKLGLLALAATALMAFASTASATTLTNKSGGVWGVGTEIHAKSNGATTLEGEPFNISCTESTVRGKIANAGGAGTAVSGPVETLTFTGCGTATVIVEQKGSLSVNSTDGTTGTVRSSGATVTVLTHSIFLGTRHCNYVTNNTVVGTFTESDHNPGSGSHTTATMHISSSPIPEEITDGTFFCGHVALWTGTYEVTSPDHIYIDN